MNVHAAAISLVGILVLSFAPATMAQSAADGTPAVEKVLIMHRKIVVMGQDFSPRATVLIDGVEQSTSSDLDHPSTRLIVRGGAEKISGHDASIQVRNPSGETSEVFASTPANQQKTVTLEDQGKTRRFKVGEDFLLYLGRDYEWTVTGFDGHIIRIVPQYVAVPGSQGLFSASTPGTTTLIVTGAPVCEGDTPCTGPNREFTVTIEVVP